jgi:hypothetical protein
MKRTPITRKTRLERSTPLTGGQPLKRGKPMRQRSKKQEALYRVRRPLVAELLAEFPVCQRCDSARSTDVHEPRMRSRGADITDREQCVCLCRPCHNFVHDHPAEATAEGWLIASWDLREAS